MSSTRTAALETAEAVREEYTRRRKTASEALAIAKVADGRIANLRLVAAGVWLLLLFLAWTAEAVSWLWLLVPTAAFVALVAWHARAAATQRAASRRIAFHERGLARLDGSWMGTGADGARFAAADHPYCDHLDVFGRGSLFQLISSARTPQGEAMLAGWLKQPSEPGAIRARQAAVTELRPRLNLREDVALLGADAATAQGLSGLSAWGEAPRALSQPWARPAAWLLPLPTLAAVALWVSGVTSGWWIVVGFILARIVAQPLMKSVVEVVSGVEAPAHDLAVLRGLLERIEAESFDAADLRELRSALSADGVSATRQIESLSRRIGFADAQRNQFWALFAMALLCEVHAALALEDWRATCGPHLREWLGAVSRFEALASVAGYAAEHPGDPFPEIASHGPLFVAEAATHPLLRDDRGVRNDIAIDADRQVYVVSGSNMSGKSTFLRTVGSNAILALAGAPVRARALSISPMTVGASIHVNDSLMDGESRFYAEVARIGRIVRLGSDGERPLLFLLDELFHGTNSKDRRTGAAAVVRALLEGGAVGLVTTHDLELARITEDLDSAVVNVHFEDQFEDGRMSFDYRMRPGVVARSNALALMRAVGLDV
jgi:hypothetical protein